MKIRTIKNLLKQYPPILILRLKDIHRMDTQDRDRIMKYVNDLFPGCKALVMQYQHSFEPIQLSVGENVNIEEMIDQWKVQGQAFFQPVSNEVKIELPKEVEILSVFNLPPKLYKKRLEQIEKYIKLCQDQN